jgi:hypothetical protein
VVKEVKKAATLEIATRAFENGYVLSGDPHIDTKVKWAQLALQAFQGSTKVDPLQTQLNLLQTSIKGRFDFCVGGIASDEEKKRFEGVLSNFIIWLQTIGFHQLDQNISICIYTKDSPIPAVQQMLARSTTTSFYLDNTLYVDKAYSADMSIPLHVYSHHALLNAAKAIDLTSNPVPEIESALADYLSASFLQSPIIGALGSRTLDNASTYLGSMDIWERGLIWAGALWTCREKAQMQMDQLILPAWEEASISRSPGKDFAKRFADTIKAAPTPVGTCFTDEIRHRQIPL